MLANVKQLNTFTPTGMLQVPFRKVKLKQEYVMVSVQQRWYTDLEQTQLAHPEHASQAVTVSCYVDPLLNATS